MATKPKTWDKMSDSEKIETSRIDIVRLFDVTNGIMRDLQALGAKIHSLQTELDTYKSCK